MSRLAQSHTLSARRNRRRALLALLVAVAISAQPATTALATSERIRINNGQSATVDDDIICEGETLRAILAENDKSKDMPTTADVSGNLSATGSYRGIAVEITAGKECETSVHVGGNAAANSPQEAQGVTQLVYGSSELTIGGNVEASVSGETKYDEHSAIGASSTTYGQGATSVTDIKGDVQVTTEVKDTLLDGVILNAKGQSSTTMTIGGDVIVSNTGADGTATGISAVNSDGTINLDVGGSVSVTGPAEGTSGIVIEDDGIISETPGETIVHIHGDVTSSGAGITLKSDNETVRNTIIIEGVLSSDGAPIHIIKSGAQIDLIVGGISSPTADIALEFDEETRTYRPTEAARAFAEAVNYIVQIDPADIETKQVPGGTISVVAQGGGTLRRVLDKFDVAQADQVIWVRVTPDEGYVVDGVFNGEGAAKQALERDAEGNYLLKVSDADSIYLSALFKKIPAPEPEPVPVPEPSQDVAPVLPRAAAALPATGDEKLPVSVVALAGAGLVLLGAWGLGPRRPSRR